MPFEARKLRVQLPCGTDTEVREAGDERGCRFPTGTPCPGKFPTDCAPAFATGCTPFPTCADFRSGACQLDSCIDSCIADTFCLWTNTVLLEDGENPRAFVAADQLPLLRERLELRLKEIDAFAQQLKDDVAAQLDEVGRAEQALKERDADQ